MNDEKLNYCRVVIEECFKLPISTSSLTNNVGLTSNITSRRQSVRLQDKPVPCMKETPPKKFKKKAKKVHDYKVEKSVASNDAANDPQNNLNELELSDNDILKMLNDYDIFLENGSYDPTILNIDEYDFQSKCDEVPEASATTTTSSVANVSCDHSSNTFVSWPISSPTQTPVNQTRTISTETEPPVVYSTFSQTDSVHRRSVSTQTEIDERSESTQTCIDNKNSMSTQTFREDYSSTSTNTEADSGRNVLKRKSSYGSVQPNHCQIFIKNYDLNNCSVNHGGFNQKLPKHSSNRMNMNSGEPKSAFPKIPRVKSSGDVTVLRQDQYQTGTPQQLRPKNNFNLMKFEISSLLQRPCHKFLKYEICDPHCQHNHSLPDAGHVAEAIRYWSGEQVHLLYVTYVQRFKMCHLKYFRVICTAFEERLSPENIVATIKDCERLALESQFVVIMSALKNCGYTDDDALFEICTHAYRSDNAMNEILKMIVTFNVANFKRTIAFLSNEIETKDFDPYFGNEILKQAAEIETLDVALVNFCYSIVRKYKCILNADYMRSLLSRIGM